MKVVQVLCEKLGTQNAHVGIMENVHVKHVSVGEQKFA